MATSKRRYEGYLMLDHRSLEGVPDATVIAAGLPPGAGRGLFETATYTCSHCQTVVVMNPLRTRERAYCRGCDHYLCDACGAIRAANGGLCKTFHQIADEVMSAAEQTTVEQTTTLVGVPNG